jgi:uncharacterized membrane protein YgaE (UPF0421/DUF939 family)
MIVIRTAITPSLKLSRRRVLNSVADVIRVASRGVRIRDRLGERDLVAELRLAIKMTGASVLAWWLATLAGEPRPIFAALIPFVAMSGDPFASVSVSVERVLGVFVGVALGAAALRLHIGLLGTVALAVAAGTLVGILLRVGSTPNVEPAVSALFLVAFGAASTFHSGFARLWETAIGAGVAILVSAFVWPPDPVRELEHRIRRLRQELGSDLASIAEDLSTGSGVVAERLDDVRARSQEVVRDFFDLDRARRALRWNPLRRKDITAFAGLEARIRLAGRLYRHTRSIARDIVDARTLPGSPSGTELAAATRDLAEAADHELRGEPGGQALARAGSKLRAVEARTEDALVIRAQLRQMLEDLEAGIPTR